MSSADEEYYYGLVLLPGSDWGDMDQIRLEFFDTRRERPGYIFVFQRLLRPLYIFFTADYSYTS